MLQASKPEKVDYLGLGYEGRSYGNNKTGQDLE